MKAIAQMFAIAVGMSLAIALCGCGRFGFDPAPIVDGDAATSDATLDDAMPIDVPDAAAACDRLFCNSFADGLAGWDGTEVEGSSRVTFDPGFGRTGGSLHATAPAGTAVAVVFKDVFAPLPTNLYVRAHVYASSAQALDLEPVEIANPAWSHQIVFGIFDDSIDIHAHNMAGDFAVMSGMVPPRDRWVCFTLHVEIGAAGKVELFLDGFRLLAKIGIDTRPPTGELSRVAVGIASKPTTTSADVYIDDVVADTAPIPCD